MSSITVWRLADRPNYTTNTDKLFPYAEVPYLGEYNLIKIPISLNNLIDHVDYWGEGRVVSEDGVRGFSNCYNVNHQFQLVSSGPDRDRKIPNRIPVVNSTNCDTSPYIKDNSVITVTATGARMSDCAKDIARIVNNDIGKVIVYGVKINSEETEILAAKLQKKGLFPCPGFSLPNKLNGLTVFKSHVAFLNVPILKEQLENDITNGAYGNAVALSKSLNIGNGEFITEILTKLINTHPRNVMAYTYKLWHGGAKDVVRNRFPMTLRLIFNEDDVTIINEQYRQALKLDTNVDSYNDRLAWGDKNDKTSHRMKWKIIPDWDNNNNVVTFKLYNVDCNMYLKLDAGVDNIGDRKAWGSYNSNEVRHKYYLEPIIQNGTLLFYIINCQYQQGLKLAVAVDSIGDRLLWGHNGNVYRENDRMRWIIEG